MPNQVFVIGIALAVAVLVGRRLTNRLGIPEAAAYVLVGIAAGLVPGIPGVQLPPELVLLVFLPPLIYFAAFFSDPRETVAHIVPVIGQSVGLVLATAAAAAGAVMAVFPDVGWAAALAFGAAIAPPDPVAATTVLQRLGVPRRLVTVLEGEGLINDGVALTLFTIALSNVGKSPSVLELLRVAAVEVVGGVVFGLVIGVVITAVRNRTSDRLSQVVVSLATPYLAFVPAHLVHASGVLATVTAAFWLGTRGRGVVEPAARMQTETFWTVLNLLLVAALFVLLGMQVPAIVGIVSGYSIGALVIVSAAVVVAVVVVRLAWALLIPPLIALLPVRDDEIVMSRSERIVLGWCGPRGAVSLAVGLSMPLTIATGGPFPRRDLLLFLTILVVLATVVFQVMSLPALLTRLKLRPGERERTEGLRARRALADAALRDLDGMSSEDEEPPPGAEALRQVLELRRERLLLETEGTSEESGDRERPDERHLRLRLLDTERRTLRELHEQGHIGARTMVDISQELDLDETRLRRPE
ncbi:Na+/H+ antiporter [Pseudonocardia spinosispora]|uniref:Na+/H+ antiporter n=1 Tax=Pseudonocardia spinosispora TaxID=103441 RepID=UPI00048F207B|nr:Na+/H+ antiporter [Pseudonocardia spinosispora]